MYYGLRVTVRVSLSLMEIPIVVPFYKPSLSRNEMLRMNINRFMNPLVIFVLPQGLRNTFVKNHGIKDEILSFPDRWFRSRESYSEFLLTPLLWGELCHYDKVLICQTDAVLIKPTYALKSLSYSLLGAPWIKTKNCAVLWNQLFVDYKKLFFLKKTKISVGNGGLSLRNPNHCLEVLQRAKEDLEILGSFEGKINEDIVFSFLFTKFKYSMPNAETALGFFMEEHAKDLVDVPDVYGFHALQRFNPELENKIFSKFSKLLN